MPRSKKRAKSPKIFFKIKEKLILVPPKKFIGRRLIGIFCLGLGSLILAFSTIYYFILPNFFPKTVPVIPAVEEKKEFVPKRLVIPSAGMDLLIKNNSYEGNISVLASKIALGEEIYLLGGGDYKIFKVTNLETTTATISSVFLLQDENLRIVLPLPGKQAKNLIINLQESK